MPPSALNGHSCPSFPSQEFAVPDFRTSHLEVGQGSQLLQQQQQQLRRRPSLLSEFHPGSDRPQERRSGYESQFHAGPSQADHDALDSKRPRLDQVSDSHYQRVSATAVLPLAHQLQEGLRSSDLKKVKPVGLTGGAETFRVANQGVIHRGGILPVRTYSVEPLKSTNLKVAKVGNPWSRERKD
uniref:Uncharacterized protein n=1 Tax=Pseudonaja textilis TaxID=8673 RepID=A0A670ZG01_PSETE